MLDSMVRELLPEQQIAVVLLVGRHDHIARRERNGMGDEIDRVRGVLGEDDVLEHQQAEKAEHDCPPLPISWSGF